MGDGWGVWDSEGGLLLFAIRPQSNLRIFDPCSSSSPTQRDRKFWSLSRTPASCDSLVVDILFCNAAQPVWVLPPSLPLSDPLRPPHLPCQISILNTVSEVAKGWFGCWCFFPWFGSMPWPWLAHGFNREH